MPHPHWPVSSHTFRALGGALVWGVVEVVALARSRWNARRHIGR